MLHHVTCVAPCDTHIVMIVDGYVWGWGRNDYGQVSSENTLTHTHTDSDTDTDNDTDTDTETSLTTCE